MLVDAMGLPLINAHKKKDPSPIPTTLQQAMIDAIPENAREHAQAVLEIYDEIVPREVCEKFAYIMSEHQPQTEAESVLKGMVVFANQYIVHSARMTLDVRIQNTALLSEVATLERRVKQLESDLEKAKGSKPVRRRKK